MISRLYSRHPPLVLLHVLLIVAAILLVYWNTLQASFQFDDFNVIVNEPRVHSWGAWLASMPGIRPLLKASYTLNWTAGSDVTGFHLFNVGIHVLNSLLVYCLAQLFYRDIAGQTETLSHQAALFSALVFALHPVHTEAVSYISGRSVSLAATFYLASLLAYIIGRDHLTWRLVSAGLFLLALAVKEMAVTLPLALLLWEAAQPARASVRTIVQRQWFYWLFVVLALLAMLLHPVYVDLLGFSLQQRSLSDNLPASVQGITYLLGKLVFPVQLNIDPAIPLLPLMHPLLIGKVVLIGILLLTALLLLRRAPWLSFGILWFFLQLAPTQSLIPRLDIANERQLYLASVGPILLITLLGIKLSQRHPRLPGRLAALFICCLLAVVTYIRNLDYRTETSLWEATARTSPHKARVFNNLGYAYQLEGNTRQARQAYLRALDMEPDNKKAAINLASLPK